MQISSILAASWHRRVHLSGQGGLLPGDRPRHAAGDAPLRARLEGQEIAPDAGGCGIGAERGTAELQARFSR
jgi:hypothetical protein